MSKKQKHTPGIIHHFIFYQHQIWVDKHGVEHEIESMEKSYIKKVISMLHDLSPSLYAKEMTYRALLLQERGLLDGTPEIQDFREEFVNPHLSLIHI